MIKHAAIYLRVSSRAQDEASQKPDLEHWAAGAKGPVHWYRDKFTGKTMDRPGWRALEARIRAGQVDRLVIWRLDRLGRTAQGLTALFEDLRQRKVNLVSLREGVDLGTPAGRLMAHVIASVAQYETEVRAERVLAGLAVAKEKGVRLGRPAGTGKPISITPEQSAMVVELRGRRLGAAEIARTVGISRRSVYLVLERGGDGIGVARRVTGGQKRSRTRR